MAVYKHEVGKSALSRTETAGNTCVAIIRKFVGECEWARSATGYLFVASIPNIRCDVGFQSRNAAVSDPGAIARAGSANVLNADKVGGSKASRACIRWISVV